MIRMTNNKTIELLMIDKQHLLKQMANLPGVPGATGKEEKALPGVPGAEGKEENDPYKMGYMEGYEAGLKDAFKKQEHEEPDSDDAGGPSDDDDDDKEEKVMPKYSITRIVKMIAKKMFASPTPVLYSPLYSEMNGVSIITIDGEIDKRTSELGKVDVDEITKALRVAEKANTSAVVLHINSPGGGSIGVQETGEVIKKLTETKPVFTYTDKLCASAAYWLASCTNGIFTTPTAELGSIGVIVKVMDYSESLKMNGISPQIFTAGEFKGMGHGEKALTDKEQEFILNDINKQYMKFKTVVNENRGGVEDSVLQGQLFSGEEAVGVNLADEIVPNIESVLQNIAQE